MISSPPWATTQPLRFGNRGEGVLEDCQGPYTFCTTNPDSKGDLSGESRLLGFPPALYSRNDQVIRLLGLFIKVWDTQNGWKNIKTIVGYNNTMLSTHFMPGGWLVISTSRDSATRVLSPLLWSMLWNCTPVGPIARGTKWNTVATTIPLRLLCSLQRWCVRADCRAT